jgi:DNA-binding PadR family transcriptional regulator
MFADHTLTPKEATRLCALGSLALSPMTYSDLAMSIRHFVSRMIGPTPEIMGHSIELLKYEGLVEAIEGRGDEALLRITDAGREDMRELLTANVRATSTALDKLIVALKLRFLHLLEPDDQCVQADMLVDVCERELSRLDDLRQHHADDAGYLVSWLDHDIGLLETRLAWLTDFRARLCDRS